MHTLCYILIIILVMLIRQSYFASVFLKDIGLTVPNLDSSPCHKLSSFVVTADDVNTLLGEVDPFKATWGDVCKYVCGNLNGCD